MLHRSCTRSEMTTSVTACVSHSLNSACTPSLLRPLPQLRHPNILAFKDSAETTEKGATVITLVTEPVKPLKDVLKELGLEGQHRWAGALPGTLNAAQVCSGGRILGSACRSEGAGMAWRTQSEEATHG